MNSNNEKQLNHLMRSLSRIDGDLLCDVEPANPARVIPIKKNRNWQRVATVAAALAVLVTTGVVIRHVMFGGAFDYKGVMISNRDKADDFLPATPEDLPGYGEEKYHAVCVVDAEDQTEASRSGRDALPGVRNALSKLADRYSMSILSASGSNNTLYSPVGLYHTLTYLERGAGGMTRDELALFTEGEVISNLSDSNPTLFIDTDNQDLLPLFVNALIVPRNNESSLVPSFSVVSGAKFYTSIYSASHAGHTQIDLVLSGRKPSEVCSQWADIDETSSPIESMSLLQSLEVSLKVETDALQNGSPKGSFHSPDGMVEGVPYYLADAIAARNFIVDKSVISEIQVAGGSLYLILPPEGTRPEDLLEKGDVFSSLAILPPEQEHSSVHFPQFSITDDHDWLGDKGITEIKQLIAKDPDFSGMMTGSGLSFSTIVQRAAIRFEPSGSSYKGQSSPSPVIEYNRPFIFVATDEYGLPLMAGVVRNPLR